MALDILGWAVNSGNGDAVSMVPTRNVLCCHCEEGVREVCREIAESHLEGAYGRLRSDIEETLADDDERAYPTVHCYVPGTSILDAVPLLSEHSHCIWRYLRPQRGSCWAIVHSE